MTRTNRNILILGILVIVLVAVGYYFLLLGPLLGNLRENVETRDGKEAQLANLRSEVAELEAVQRNAPDIERQLLEYSKRIPTQPQIETLIIQVEEIADAAGVTQLSIQPGTPGPPPGGGDYSEVPITMSFEGTYEQLQFFLENARNLSRLMTVNRVTYCLIEPLGAGETTCPIETPTTGETTTVEEVEQMLQVEIEADVYFQPSVEPSNVPAGTAPAAPPAPETTTDAQ